MKYFLIFNPIARQGRCKKKWKKILSLLRKKKVSFEYRITQKPTDAVDFSFQAVNDGWETIVAVGGDGTVCEVITGLFMAGKSYLRPKLGVIHVGTSPDFNRYHQIPTKIEEVIEVLLGGKTKLIDIGKIVYLNKNEGVSLNKLDAHPEKRFFYFASNVNIGLGPRIASRANGRYRKFLGDFLGTLSATLISLINFKEMNLFIKIDERSFKFSKLINLTIGKDPFLASGMRVFSQIKPDDSRLYILPIEKTSVISLLFNIPRIYWGNFLKYRGAQLIYGKGVEIEYNPDYPEIEFDGDVRGYLPAKVEVLPKALEIVVP